MNQFHKIAILGGSGKAGTYLVQEALQQGYSCKLLLRHPEKWMLNHPLIEIIKGDVRNKQEVLDWLQECQAIISTLGQPKGQEPIFSQACSYILQGMQALDIRRYILTAGLNVEMSGDQKSERTQMATEWMQSHFPDICEDRQKELELLTQSKVDWTLVRLPMIIPAEELQSIKVNLHDCPGENVSTRSLALFLLSQLADDSYIRKAPFIAHQ